MDQNPEPLTEATPLLAICSSCCDCGSGFDSSLLTCWNSTWPLSVVSRCRTNMLCSIMVSRIVSLWYRPCTIDMNQQRLMRFRVSSAHRRLSQIASLAASETAIYPASIDKHAIVGCRVDFHEIAAPVNMKTSRLLNIWYLDRQPNLNHTILLILDQVHHK